MSETDDDQKKVAIKEVVQKTDNKELDRTSLALLSLGVSAFKENPQGVKAFQVEQGLIFISKPAVVPSRHPELLGQDATERQQAVIVTAGDHKGVYTLLLYDNYTLDVNLKNFDIDIEDILESFDKLKDFEWIDKRAVEGKHTGISKAAQVRKEYYAFNLEDPKEFEQLHNLPEIFIKAGK